MLYYNITPIIWKRNSYFFLTFWQKIVTTVNSDAAATTIDGPEGVSNANEKYIPKATDVTPNNDDNNDNNENMNNNIVPSLSYNVNHINLISKHIGKL